jgi:hypothetical protein
MLSVGLALANVANHLPQNWRYSQGLKSLFPTGYKGSISPLQRYVFWYYSEQASETFNSSGPYGLGNFWFTADAQGRWFFGWMYGSCDLSADYARQAGFAFKFAVGGKVLGFVDTSRPAVATRSCSGGTDDVIARNWPQLFGGKIAITYQITSDPKGEAPLTWTNAVPSAVNPVTLAGANVTAEGGGSGSTLFPFPGTTPDCYIAAIIGGSVARALKAKRPVAADAALVKSTVTSPRFISPSVSAILAFLDAPVCTRVISDARVIATQVHTLQDSGGGSASSDAHASALSSYVTAPQILAAGRAAYYAVTAAKKVPVDFWKKLEALNARD